MSYYAKNLPGVKHCFFDRFGGVSEGLYQSMNFNWYSDDKAENIMQNLEIAAGSLKLKTADMLMMHQGVTSEVVYVERASFKEVTADGAVTDQLGVALCITTADCAPVLLADYKNGVIGAAHAGWRGAFKGVIENTVNLMLEKGAKVENICAAVGPCIGQPSYEVDEGFYRQFLNASPAAEKYFCSGNRPGHYYFDLGAYCHDKLAACHIGNITVADIDTYVTDNGYFSFRRNMHQGLITGGAKNFPVELSTITL